MGVPVLVPIYSRSESSSISLGKELFPLLLSFFVILILIHPEPLFPLNGFLIWSPGSIPGPPAGQFLPQINFYQCNASTLFSFLNTLFWFRFGRTILVPTPFQMTKNQAFVP